MAEHWKAEENRHERQLTASDPADVVFLSQAVADTPTRLQPSLLAEVYSLGLMLAQPLWVRIMFGLTLKVGGRGLLTATLMEFQARRPDVLRMWVAEVAVHIRYGLDIEDSASVGGWSQREFDLFQSRISVSRLKGQS